MHAGRGLSALIKGICRVATLEAHGFAVYRYSVAMSSPGRGAGAAGRPSSGPRRSHGDPGSRTSREMSRLLRHKPPPGAMDAAGWVDLPVLMRHLRQNVTEKDIRDVVNNCMKKRFVLDDSSDPPRIRAAQGHSIALEDPVLLPVTSTNAVPVAVHVTSTEGWDAIRESGELRRMGRTHIHFATEPGHMRKNTWVTVVLRLRLEAALAAGHSFYMSSNGVLLCEGPLPVQFVHHVQPEDLPDEWHAALVPVRSHGKVGSSAGRAAIEPKSSGLAKLTGQTNVSAVNCP